jgi:hypothetical protein
LGNQRGWAGWECSKIEGDAHTFRLENLKTPLGKHMESNIETDTDISVSITNRLRTGRRGFCSRRGQEIFSSP